MPEELVSIPTDLTLVGDQELQGLEVQAAAEFDRLNATDDLTPEHLQRLNTLADDIDRVRAELAVRETRAKKHAEQQRAKLTEQREHLKTRVHGASGDGDTGSPEGGGSIDAESIAAAAAQGTAAALVAALGDRAFGRDLVEATQRATASLSDARRHAPAVAAPKPLLAVTAGVDIPGLARGADLGNLPSLVDAFHRRARGMPTTRDGAGNRQLVATVRNEYEHTIDDRTTPGQVEELFNHLTSPDRAQALVAGGGWCAPSEIRYDFFNIACEDGQIDLPTFGVSRGGIRYPVSPSLADVYGDSPNQAFGGFSVAFTNDSNPWLWTEDDDKATVTGEPNKPCIRVPCPTFAERRLECYGICVTAGNLTDDAYPEATRNFLRLMMSAHSHAMNQRIIATMVGLSDAITTGGQFATAGPAFTQLYNGAELAAIDYRERYGMCETDIVEIVLPKWIVGVLRADLARRTGVEQTLSVTRAQLMRYFADRNIRVQLVSDWQVRGAGQFGGASNMTDWPATVDLMVYAAGTFLLGNGLTLDLGVVRDSVLNAENDHTAAWSEECHLVAKVGHASRQYRVTFEVLGDPARVDTTVAVNGGL